MDNHAAILDRAIAAEGIPITGVSIGDVANRGTWSVQFSPAATAPQRTRAAELIASVPVDAPAQAVEAQRTAQATIDTIPISTKAIVLALVDAINVLRTHSAIGLPAVTPAQALASIRAKAGTL